MNVFILMSTQHPLSLGCLLLFCLPVLEEAPKGFISHRKTFYIVLVQVQKFVLIYSKAYTPQTQERFYLG